MIAAVVLAAGGGSRFGGTKQLAVVRGTPLVRRAVEAARGAGIERILVVVGNDADAVAVAAGPDAEIVRNDNWRKGQSSSLVAALDAAHDDVEGVVVLLADQPSIREEHVRALLDASAARPEPIVRLRFADAPGPALLRRDVWDELRRLRGDVGARALIERRPGLVFDVVISAPAPLDVDTRADLDRARADGFDAGCEEPPPF